MDFMTSDSKMIFTENFFGKLYSSGLIRDDFSTYFFDAIFGNFRPNLGDTKIKMKLYKTIPRYKAPRKLLRD